MRRHLEWLLQLCFIWHVMKIIKTHGELLSKETAFQLQKHPAVNREEGEFIKNIPKIRYNIERHEDETAKGNEYSSNNNSGSNTAEILNVFKTILQQIHRNECERIERKEEQNSHEGDLPPHVTEERKGQYEAFSILQQLKLDDQKEKWQQQQQQLKLHLQEQQNALKLQQIMQQLNAESLGKADKNKKKKKRKKRKRKKPVKDKKKKRKKKPIKHETALLAHPAHILFASPTQKPQHYNHGHNDHYYQQMVTTTTKPSIPRPLVPIKKIKYILRKNTIFKKKKKEYLNHLKHVLYPFVKFIAFFTIINPFTLAVFLFSLISPVVFGFLGFIGLSFLIKPALHLLFGVKQTVNAIKRQKLRALRKRQRLRDSRRPITIHKHYYQQKPIVPHHRYHLPPLHPPLKPEGPHHHSNRLRYHHHHHPRQIQSFNPLLPAVRQKLKKDTHFIPDFKDYTDDFE